MKKLYWAFILFWAAVIAVKVWAGFHGQTTLADSVSEITGFACLLAGTGLCAIFSEMQRRRLLLVGLERAAGEMAERNFFALLLQGILLLCLGLIAVFLKWWIAVIAGAPFLLGVILLFFRGWPNVRLNPDSVARTVQKTRRELGR